MIVSESFVQSSKARDVEFTTCNGDRPLVAQFAASNARDFADAALIIAPFVDAVDLNCGCPQRWAMADGYGAQLMSEPELVTDMVRQAKSRSGLPVSVKMRIHKNLKDTVEFVRRAEHAGAAWISVHGRTSKQRAEPANMDAIKLVKESVGVPVVANGDVKNEADIRRVHEHTGVNGVMSARGILDNPAMYGGYDHTPISCVQDWVEIALRTGMTFTLFHHHLIFMLDRVLTRPEQRVFNTLSSVPAVLDYLEEHYGVCLYPAI
ncbi:tRNA-dihydrouridine(20a/20b) synthase [NAD(P)+]-like isoform X2 [Halichondria panicea]